MIVENFIKLNNDELSKREWSKLFKALTFLNDEGELVECFRQVITRGYTKIPRGAWNLLPDHVEYWDRRSCPPRPEFHFTVTLDDTEKDERFRGQSEAVAAMFEHEQGLILRPPGTGKTQIALAFAARAKTRTLVIVHTADILQQWIEYAQTAVPDMKVGVIRGKKCTIGDITIATVQTLRKYISEEGKRWWAQFGCVILDEAHHASAPTFEAVLNTCPARYRFGFTATDKRADGMHPSMKFIIGPVIHKQDFSSPIKLSVEPVPTSFRFRYRGAFDWMPMLNALIEDEKRNKQIAEIALYEIQRGNSILILSRRIEHLERISAHLDGAKAEILTGQRRSVDRKRILAAMRSGELRCLLATQLADEALDIPRLNRGILTHPGKHEGRIIQQIGRTLRQHADKEDAIIYDMRDDHVSILKRQWHQRRQTYRKNRIKIRGKAMRNFNNGMKNGYRVVRKKVRAA